LSNQLQRFKRSVMTDSYTIIIQEISERLIQNIILMDQYAKFEVKARDEIDEALLYSDSMKALDRAAQRLNDAYVKSLKSA
jgi:hypothetical protein